MATPPGFEPRLTGPKPVVLPLHHGVVFSIKYHRLRKNQYLKLQSYTISALSGMAVPAPGREQQIALALEARVAASLMDIFSFIPARK